MTWEHVSPYIAIVLTVALTLIALGHVVLTKTEEARAAIGWAGVVVLLPVVGATLYLLLGINRVRRRAVALRGDQETPTVPIEPPTAELGSDLEGLRALAGLVEGVCGRSLRAGNKVQRLDDGDEAYPAMIAAIESAEHTVHLATYIFDNDAAGRLFEKALGEAVKRGVTCRVLIDAIGLRYSIPSIRGALKRAGCKVARFAPTLWPWRLPYANLRNHRKLLIVDGSVAFTGGLNIRAGHILKDNPEHPVRDMHFRLDGPVVTQLQEVFATDWAFATREVLRSEDHYPPIIPCGPVLARAISDGPDGDLNKLRLTILGALSVAQRRVRVVSPYFLPDSDLITGLSMAAMRGVGVDVVLPAENNHLMVKWAATASLSLLLERGVRIWMTPAPFDHTKLLVVDGKWALIGSGNLDPRSLRLNFELNVECYEPKLASELDGCVEERMAKASRVTREQLDGRPLWVKLRDGFARLFQPYL